MISKLRSFLHPCQVIPDNRERERESLIALEMTFHLISIPILFSSSSFSCILFSLVLLPFMGIADTHSHHHQQQYPSYEMSSHIPPVAASCSSEEERTTCSSSSPSPSKVKMWRCNFCRKVLKVPEDGDKRLASSYPSFIIGKLLSIVGSIGLLVGLTLKFFFLDDEGTMRVISYFIACCSLVVFSIGAFLVIWATLYKSQKARKEFDCERSGGGRPASTLSSASFQSHSSTTGILEKRRKANNVHAISVPDTTINC